MMIKHYSTLAMAVMVGAGLIFAGCAKKEVAVEPETAKQGAMAGGAVITPETKGVSGEEGVTSGAMIEEPANAVYFAFDKYDLDAAARAILDNYAEWLKAHPSTKVTVEGNCDERGTREYNLALGQRRADAVRDYLISSGIDGNRIDTVSFGEERPACQGTGEACWAQNRRADIVVR